MSRIASDLRLQDIAEQLGLEVRRNRIVCPACNKGGSRPPCILVRGGVGWRCFGCDESGDLVDAVSWRLLSCRAREAGSRFAEVKTWLEERSNLAPPEREDEPPPQRIPTDELVAMLRRCGRPTKDIAEWLSSRGIDPANAPCGVVPPNFTTKWWPTNYSRDFPIVIPALLPDGTPGAVHGVAWERERVHRKTTWARGVSSGGTVFADPWVARPWMRGGPYPARLVIVEGSTDYLALASRRLPGTAVIGFESGSALGVCMLPWQHGQIVEIATDPDDKGDLYQKQIVEVLPEYIRWERRRRRDGMDVTDALRSGWLDDVPITASGFGARQVST